MRKIWINGEDFSFCRKNANEIPAQDTQKRDKIINLGGLAHLVILKLILLISMCIKFPSQMAESYAIDQIRQRSFFIQLPSYLQKNQDVNLIRCNLCR